MHASCGSSLLSFQQGQETLFEAGLFRTDRDMGSTGLVGPSLQLSRKVQRTGDREQAMLRSDRVARVSRDPGYQVELRCFLGKDFELASVIQEVAGGTVEEGFPLVEHDQPVRDLFQFSQQMTAEEDGLALLAQAP